MSTDLNSLNAALSDAEKKLVDLYCEIGKLYCSIHDEYKNKIDVQLGLIASTQEKIDTIKKRLEENGNKRCEKCGAIVPDRFTFCNNCGAPLLKQNTEIDSDQVICESCGAIVDKTVGYCTNCGKPIAKPEDREYIETMVPIVDTQDSAPAQKYPVESSDAGLHDASSNNNSVQQATICPQCGAKVRVNARFCTSCGYYVSSDAAEQSSESEYDQASGMKKCPSCGSVTEPDAAFCTECGARLG